MVHVFGGKLRAALADLHHTLDQIDRRVDKMETILMIREPSSVAAADAYEGLRKQVVNAVSERLVHLTQLVQFDEAMRQHATAEDLAKLVDAWLEQASLRRVADAASPDADLLYDLVSDAGGALEVLSPAYVDSVTGRVIRTGRARRTAAGAVPPALAAAEIIDVEVAVEFQPTSVSHSSVSHSSEGD